MKISKNQHITKQGVVKNNPRKNKVRVFNYNEWKEFDNIEKAKAFYLEGMSATDRNSSEHQRYKTIYRQLSKGMTVVTDGVI